MFDGTLTSSYVSQAAGLANIVPTTAIRIGGTGGISTISQNNQMQLASESDGTGKIEFCLFGLPTANALGAMATSVPFTMSLTTAQTVWARADNEGGASRSNCRLEISSYEIH